MSYLLLYILIDNIFPRFSLLCFAKESSDGNSGDSDDTGSEDEGDTEEDGDEENEESEDEDLEGDYNKSFININ